MYQDFIEALNVKYNCASKAELSGLDLQHYNFASSTNARAKDTIAVFEAYGFDMKGLKILDVGCAYGGFSIEAANKGAICTGIEVSKPLYEFACLNNKGVEYTSGKCEFYLTDATSVDCLEKLPHDFYDLVIVNDVFEHVYDTVQLLKNLSIVSNSHAALFFLIPNGNALRFVAREGHSGHPGLSIIRPLSWTKLTKEHIWNIYYRQYDYYKALFTYYGFENIVELNYPNCYSDENIRSDIEEEYKKALEHIDENKGQLPENYLAELMQGLSTFEEQLDYDLKSLTKEELGWKYLTTFWMGFAIRGSRKLSIPTCTTERRFSEENVEQVSFELIREADKLAINLSCELPEDEYEFAYYLIRPRQVKCVEKSCYTQHKYHEWNIDSPGLYAVVIHVKQKCHEVEDYKIVTQPLFYPGM